MIFTDTEYNALWLSVKVAVMAVLINFPPAVILGYWLANKNFRGKFIIETLVNLPLVLPPVVTGYFLLVLFGIHGPLGKIFYDLFGLRFTFTWLGAMIASAVVSFPLMVRSIRTAFRTVDRRLVSAAHTLGATPLDAFFSVSLPLAIPGLLAGGIVGFARSVGEFGATILIAGNIEGKTQTIPLAIYSILQRPDGFPQIWRLLVLSTGLACIALILSELLERKETTNEHS